jgi:hypothetical protein
MKFENFKWTHREKIASAVIGGISTIFLVAAIYVFKAPFPISTFLDLGLSLNGFAVALSPQILFEHVPIKSLKSRDPVFFGGAAVLYITGDACLLIAAWFWFLEKLY